MPAFTVPSYPLTMNIWHSFVVPPSGPPDVSGAECSISAISIPLLAAVLEEGLVLTHVIRCPSHVDLRGVNDLQGLRFSPAGDTVELPARSGNFFAVYVSQEVGKGFDNNHRRAYAVRRVAGPGPQV